ncbi:unnamed protein product [Closterium sp. NIES-54]
MVDGTKLPIHGKSTLQLQIGALRWKPTLPITNIKGLDFILGQDFLKRFNPEIDWVNRKTCIYNNGKRVDLRSWTDTGSVPETTRARFERTVNESNTGYLALVMAAAEEEWEKDLAVRKGSGKIWVPNYTPLRQILLEEFHDVPYAGHFGSNKTLAGIAKYYYWPRMVADVQQFVTSCDTCQRMKSSKQKKPGLLQPLLVPEQPWQVVSLNFITGLPSTSRGHDSILVVIDKFSKMGHFISTNATAPAEATACLFFDRIITIYGIPATLISDRDPKFTNRHRHDAILVVIQKFSKMGHFIPTNATATDEATACLYFDRIVTIHDIPATLISDRDPSFTSKFRRKLMGLLGRKLAMSSAYHPHTDKRTK